MVKFMLLFKKSDIVTFRLRLAYSTVLECSVGLTEMLMVTFLTSIFHLSQSIHKKADSQVVLRVGTFRSFREARRGNNLLILSSSFS